MKNENGRIRTGWVFRGIKKPQLTREENKAYSNHTIAPRRVTLPLRSIWATQEWINDDYDTTDSSEGMLPIVIKKDGEFFLMDGHHRSFKVADEGSQRIYVDLYDFDRTLDETPLLDYDAQRAQKDKDEIEWLLKELTEPDEGLGATPAP